MTNQTLSDQWTDNVQCAIKDVYLYDFGHLDNDKKYPYFRQSPKVMAECLVNRRDEFLDLVNDRLHQDFDSAVIYTQTAKDIVQCIGLADIFETSEMSGERFESWEHCAYENLYLFVNENIDIEREMTNFFTDKMVANLSFTEV